MKIHLYFEWQTGHFVSRSVSTGSMSLNSSDSATKQ